MSEVRAIALSVITLLGAFAVVAPASFAVHAQSSSGGAASLASGAPAANNTSMGGKVSTFMHASAGQASASVESGMWNAAFSTASNKSEVVDSRAADIANRITELREQKQDLVAARQNDEISRAEYQARMAAVVGRMAALNRSIDETEQQARLVGANVTRVQRLRENASTVAGPEVSTVARSLAGGPPEGVPAASGGPPNHAGPGNGNDKSPNGTAEPGNDGQETPGNDGQGSSGNDGGGSNGQGNGDDKGNQ